MSEIKNIFDKLDSYKNLSEGWDSYNAIPPSLLSIDNARRFIILANQLDFHIEHLSPTVVGGIAISKKINNKKFYVEFYNDGKMLYMLSDSNCVDSIIQDFSELEFLSVINKSKEHLDEKFKTISPCEKLTNIAKQFGVLNAASFVLKDSRFEIWSGSSKSFQHHYGKGGLVQHTLEVVDLCLLNNDYFPSKRKVKPFLLFLAALFHDAGKMWDYQPIEGTDYKEWEGTKHKRLIHHISRSALVWNDAVQNDADLQPYKDEVLHAILAHHQMREWGSPVAPGTRLAWILTLSDSISARMDDADRMDRFK